MNRQVLDCASPRALSIGRARSKAAGDYTWSRTLIFHSHVPTASLRVRYIPSAVRLAFHAAGNGPAATNFFLRGSTTNESPSSVRVPRSVLSPGLLKTTSTQKHPVKIGGVALFNRGMQRTREPEALLKRNNATRTDGRILIARDFRTVNGVQRPYVAVLSETTAQPLRIEAR
jgi:hypothetical protein